MRFRGTNFTSWHENERMGELDAICSSHPISGVTKAPTAYSQQSRARVLEYAATHVGNAMVALPVEGKFNGNTPCREWLEFSLAAGAHARVGATRDAGRLIAIEMLSLAGHWLQVGFAATGSIQGLRPGDMVSVQYARVEPMTGELTGAIVVARSNAAPVDCSTDQLP